MTRNKSTLLKELILSPRLEFLMEAHDGLSAKIAQEEGFRGIWASSLTLSAAQAIRDNNELSWTQILDVCEFMSDVTTIPILLDADTGYGNFNNVRRLVHKLEQRSIAGFCIEDKLFPKTNSFINSENQALEDIDTFCGKIKSAKDSQQNDDFVVVARTEAFIAGHGLNEALKRAEAYRKAGADAILVHSKRSTAIDIDTFMAEWGNRHPIIIVPTKYFSTPTEHFSNLNISAVIWANHNLRASIAAMQQTCRQIYAERSVKNIENRVASVQEIFRLQCADELEEAEKRYLPAGRESVSAVILAAAQGEKLGQLTAELPKALLKINGKTILDTQLADLQRAGITQINVVRGFGKEHFTPHHVKYINNDHYATTTELTSLQLALENIDTETVIIYGDIIFKYHVLFDVLNNTSDITLVCDCRINEDNDYHDYVSTDIPYQRRDFTARYKLTQAGSTLDKSKITGEFIGLMKCSAAGIAKVKKTLAALSKRPDFASLRITDLFNALLETDEITVQFTNEAWIDVNNVFSLQKIS